jgi:lysophospholipase L1-like esterase
MILKRVVFLAAIVGLIGVTFGYCAFAEGLDWTQDKFTVASAVERPASQQERVVDCNDTTIDYKEYDTDELRQIEACVTTGDGVQIAHSISSGRYYIATPTSGTFVALQFYGHMSLIPGTARVVMDINSELYIVYNILAHLDSHPSWDTHLIYSLNLAERDFPAAGVQQGITRYGISRNGRYVVYNAGDSYGVPGKLIRYDMETKENRVFGASPYASVYSGYPVAALGVSDDGSTVVAGGSTDLKFWHITDSCLGPTQPQGPMNGYDTCPHKLYSQSDYGLIQGPETWYPTTDDFHFDDTGSELQFGYHGGASVQRTVTLYAPGHVDDHLDYLALGDSYSSGEGDISKKSDGSSYYLPGTELSGQCHISSRSYPFLLRDYWAISPTKMKSVACSGAWMTRDYYTPVKNYLGQHSELRDKSESYIASERQSSLDTFRPGVVPQLEFVKKYKPKVLTITGGGNDVGFADILSYCATPIWNEPPVSETCGYAYPGYLHDLLWDAIHSQYDYTVRLIHDLQQASPTTSIYIIGYPSFVTSHLNICSFNSGLLDRDELNLLNSAVTEMNLTLRHAAESTGVRFIDIEKALEGGRLCEGSKYVTGVVDAYQADERFDQAFHPNAAGHNEIATVIEKAIGPDPNLQHYTTPITLEELEVGTPTYPVTLVQEPTMSEESSMGMSLKASFRPGTVITVAEYSNAIDLGTFLSTADGSLEASVKQPASAKPGRHLLVVTGTSISGKPVRYFQYITITGNKTTGKGGDGTRGIENSCSPFKQILFGRTTDDDTCEMGGADSIEGDNGMVFKAVSERSTGKTSADNKDQGPAQTEVAREPSGGKITNDSSNSTLVNITMVALTLVTVIASITLWRKK